MSVQPVAISIIVPVYNNARDLRECLTALFASAGRDAEILVVDDASTDGSPHIAMDLGVRLIRMEKNSGVAAARNAGARQAQGEILFFVDADVVVSRAAVERVINNFQQTTDLAAVFGSYDAQPRAQSTISQYRNLLHHFVHQNGSTEASTFWAGCGAVRRSAFEAVGGFDETRYRYPSIEDIELGYRLKRAGYRILLDKDLQGTHLKKWTLGSVIRTDVTRRALPWARLILESNKTPDDLNLKLGQRLSGLLVTLACPIAALATIRSELLVISAAALIVVIVLNRDLYGFFRKQRGLVFALACIPLHFLYYLYSVGSYLYVWIAFRLRTAIFLGKPTGERQIG